MNKTIEGTLKIKGGEVNYAAFGKGDASLVIIPGLSLREVKGNGTMLSMMYKIFHEAYRTYIFDRKSNIPEGYTIRQMTEDLAESMQAVGIEQADVIGISQGGMIGLNLALDYPRLVHKLVLGVTASRPNAYLKEVIGRWAAFARKEDYLSVVEDMLPTIYSEKYQKKYGRVFPLVLKLVKVIPPRRFAILANACLTCDVYDRLEKIQCPVFVIGGEKDKVVGPEASKEIAEKLNCRIYLYEEYGHSAYEEAKDFNQRIYEFLRSDEIQE